MKFQTRLARLAAAIALAASFAPAIETDQFTVPVTPLSDIGPDLSRKVVDIIESDRSGHDPEYVLSAWVGGNVLTSRLARWVKNLRAAGRPVGFRPDLPHSIYRHAFSPLLVSFLFDSDTVHLYGYYLGTDKIDHFFQQGHGYFELVRKLEAQGAVEARAIAAAVAHGVKQEHLLFGTLVSGVYSNADLAANYAGMKFYLNLRHPVSIDGRRLPPLLERGEGGRWRLRPGVDPDRLLEPFLSNHLDESLNPSRYRFSRASIRSMVRGRCADWGRFYADRLDLVAPPGRSFAATWFGEDYGHWLPQADEISIATECGSGSGAGAGLPKSDRALPSRRRSRF